MNKKKEKENEKEKYINIDTNKIIYCPQCNVYIIYIKEMIETEHNHFSTSFCCDNCKNPHIQNVFVDEAKIYFDSKYNTKRRKFIGPDYSGVKIRYYSWKIITNMANK